MDCARTVEVVTVSVMTHRTSGVAALSVCVLLTGAATVAGQAATRARPDAYRAEIRAFQAERTAGLQADDGWLTVAGLFWLKPGPNVAGSAPGSDVLLPRKAPARLGVFELKDGRVTFLPDPAAHVTSAGKHLGTAAFEAPKDDETALEVRDLRLFVIQREDRFGVRMRDLRSAARRGFTGLKFFPIRPAYRVSATFVPYEQPRKVVVPNVLGQALEMTSPGYVTFTLAGKQLRLEPVYESDERSDLFFIFKDLTSRDATYGAGRFLYAPLPKGGTVDLDFNRAYNPPCAYTDFATCPLPPKQNQLDVRIEAGELAYHVRGAVPLRRR